MPEMEYVYQKATYHKILQAWNSTKFRLGHSRDILLSCREVSEDVGKLVNWYIMFMLKVLSLFFWVLSVSILLSAASSNYIIILLWTMRPMENWLNS